MLPIKGPKTATATPALTKVRETVKIRLTFLHAKQILKEGKIFRENALCVSKILKKD